MPATQRTVYFSENVSLSPQMDKSAFCCMFVTLSLKYGRFKVGYRKPVRHVKGTHLIDNPFVLPDDRYECFFRIHFFHCSDFICSSHKFGKNRK